MDRADIVAKGLIASALMVVITVWSVFDDGVAPLVPWGLGVCTVLVVAATLVVAFYRAQPGDDTPAGPTTN